MTDADESRIYGQGFVAGMWIAWDLMQRKDREWVRSFIEAEEVRQGAKQPPQL